MTRWDALWLRLTRVLSFLGGMAIAFYETVADRSDRFWPYGIAAAMMGLPLAAAAQDALTRVVNSRPARPEKPTPEETAP